MSDSTAEKKSVPLNMDEIMKILFNLSDELTIRMINSLFGKKIPLNAKVIVRDTAKRRFSFEGHEISTLYADMILEIDGDIYHIEFQTVNDDMMLPRMFEYGFIISIEEVKSRLIRTADGMNMTYPKQYVIFVERDDTIPENELTMKVTLWDGDVKDYKVPIMRYWEETADSLEAKHLEPLLPLQVFKIRRDLERISKSRKPEAEKQKLTEDKLREVIVIYKTITEKVRDLTDAKGRLTIYHAEQMLNALQHLSTYLYDKYDKYNEIESEAIKMSKSAWGLVETHNKALLEGELKNRKETAHDMFVDGEVIEKIRKYSKLSDEDLVGVLVTLPQTIQNKYNLKAEV
jgi:hypothetical protein